MVDITHQLAKLVNYLLYSKKIAKNIDDIALNLMPSKGKIKTCYFLSLVNKLTTTIVITDNGNENTI